MRKKLRVFRVQPESYDAMRDAIGEVSNVSERVRELIGQACEAPPAEFPRRGVKVRLREFPLFMDENEHGALVSAAQSAGVSKNLFLETVFRHLGAQRQAEATA